MEETIIYVLGRDAYDKLLLYLDEKGCKRRDIPYNLILFQETTHVSLGMNQMPAPLLLRTILERLCNKIGIEYNNERAYHFVEYVKELKIEYLKRKGGDID